MDPYASRGIPTVVKRAVLERDGYACHWCSTAVSPRGSGPWRPDELQFDHLKPWGDGGEHEVDNLVVACARCNLGRPKPRASLRVAKGDRLLVEVVEYRHGYYHWIDTYRPPTVLDDSGGVALSLEAYMERGRRRRGQPLTLLEALRPIHRGYLPATAEGRVYVGYVPPPLPARRAHRMRMGHSA